MQLCNHGIEYNITCCILQIYFQQCRLIPQLAATYALKIYGDYVARVYESFLIEMMTNSGSEKLVRKN